LTLQQGCDVALEFDQLARNGIDGLRPDKTPGDNSHEHRPCKHGYIPELHGTASSIIRRGQPLPGCSTSSVARNIKFGPKLHSKETAARKQELGLRAAGNSVKQLRL
jgi:hypothetical protein